jgi:hypothetical protein
MCLLLIELVCYLQYQGLLAVGFIGLVILALASPGCVYITTSCCSYRSRHLEPVRLPQPTTKRLHGTLPPPPPALPNCDQCCQSRNNNRAMDCQPLRFWSRQSTREENHSSWCSGATVSQVSQCKREHTTIYICARFVTLRQPCSIQVLNHRRTASKILGLCTHSVLHRIRCPAMHTLHPAPCIKRSRWQVCMGCDLPLSGGICRSPVLAWSVCLRPCTPAVCSANSMRNVSSSM